METNSKSLKSFQADMTVENFNAQLGETDTNKGKLIYFPQKNNDFAVRIDWDSPNRESLAVVDKQYLLYHSRLKQAFLGRIDDSKIAGSVNEAMAFMNVSKDQLKANYNIKYVGQEKLSNGTLTWHLEFTPKVKKYYKKAEVWADKNGTPIKMKVVQNNADTITVLFTNIKKNITINPNVFKINLPKGTKIVKG